MWLLHRPCWSSAARRCCFTTRCLSQWKPTIFNWALALAFGVSQFIGEKNLMQRTLGSQIAPAQNRVDPTQPVVDG